MRRVVQFLAIAVMCALSAPAAELKLSPELQPILDLAASVPPEFAAQAMLRMVSSGRIKDKDARRELLLRTFESAASAHEHLMRRAIPGVSGDSVAGALDQAYRLKLDMTSLQSEAVLLLLRDDKRKARELFNEIPRPSVPALACTDALVYDTTAYVDALKAVEEQAFTDAERRKEDQVSFLLTYLTGITSPSELPAAARLIAGAGGITKAERDLLVNRFNGIMDNIASDPRAYSAIAGDLASSVTPVMRPSFERLAARMRSAACGNTPAEKPDTQLFWQSEGSKKVLAAGRKVRFGDNRQTPEWQDRFNNFVAGLDAWVPDPNESQAAYFHERVIIYEGLMDVAPTPEARRDLLDDFVGFINGSPIEEQNPPEWFSVIPAMWQRIPFRGPAEREALTEALAHSGNPVISLYLMLEKTIPETPGGRR